MPNDQDDLPPSELPEKDKKKVKAANARAKSLTKTERSEIAKGAADARWGRAFPRATHFGKLIIAGTEIECVVLNNGKRLLSQETFLTAIGRSRKGKGGQVAITTDGLPPFLAADVLKPFVSDELRQSTVPLVYQGTAGRKLYGYDAMLLPMVCEVYLDARDAGATTRQQSHIVRQCDLLMRGFARVGIIALVDEATGYQDDRARDELARILEAYISEELRPWVRTFPVEFFKQVYRIHGWVFDPSKSQRTPLVGKIINKYIYDQFPPGVLPTLKDINPVTETGRRKHKHFQFLTADTGNLHLDRQITAVTTIMKVSDSKSDFEDKFRRAFGKENQGKLPLIIDVPPASDAAKAPPTKSSKKKPTTYTKKLFDDEDLE